MLYYFSDFFDNFYKQNSNLELIWKCILTGGLHKHAILISDSGRNLLKAAEQNTECIYTRFMHKGVFSCDNYVWNILGVRRFYLCDLFM